MECLIYGYEILACALNAIKWRRFHLAQSLVPGYQLAFSVLVVVFEDQRLAQLDLSNCNIEVAFG